MDSSNLDTMVDSLGLHESVPKRHLDRFSIFLRITQQRLPLNLVCMYLIISEILFCLNFYWRQGNIAKVYNAWLPSSIGRTWSTWLQRRPRRFCVSTGLPNGPVLFCSLASVVIVCRCLSSVVYNTAGGRAGRPPCVRAVGRPTLHGGPVV